MSTYVKTAGILVRRDQKVRTTGGDVTQTNTITVVPITPPTVPPDPGVPPQSVLDYQTGNFSQWTEQHLARAVQEAIVATPARVGYPATARFIVASGDHTFGQVNEERAEVMATSAQTGNPIEGGALWYAWSSFFPTGTYVDPAPSWLAFTQWHQTANSGVPNVAFFLNPGIPVKAQLVVRGQSLNLTTGAVGYYGEWVLGTVPLNSWVDFTVHITWSANPALGRVTVKINGTQAADVACATLFAGQSAYMKQGIYRANSARTHTIYHTGTRCGTTEASVRL